VPQDATPRCSVAQLLVASRASAADKSSSKRPLNNAIYLKQTFTSQHRVVPTAAETPQDHERSMSHLMP
jgi:hypothetical protein